MSKCEHFRGGGSSGGGAGTRSAKGGGSIDKTLNNKLNPSEGALQKDEKCSNGIRFSMGSMKNKRTTEKTKWFGNRTRRGGGTLVKQ